MYEKDYTDMELMKEKDVLFQKLVNFGITLDKRKKKMCLTVTVEENTETKEWITTSFSECESCLY